MGLLFRLGRFLTVLSKPLRNPYTLVVLLLAISGSLTALRGPGSLVWGGILLWMALMLRLQHSQSELLRACWKALEEAKVQTLLKHPLEQELD